ncbi:hypothetical protein REPUB_Repub20aG0001600 [Reevesia pubescens]
MESRRQRGDQGFKKEGLATVFVNNLPPRVHWRWLWKIFQNHGNVVDVFIPRNRGVKGRKFSFVRFVNQVTARRAVIMLNGSWLFDFQLGVNLARFNARSNYLRRVKPSSELGSGAQVGQEIGISNTRPSMNESEAAQVQRRSYIQALNGINPEVQYRKVLDVDGNSEKKVGDDSEKKDNDDSASLNSHDSGLIKLKSCLGVVDNEALHKLESYLVGVAKDYYETGSLMENFRMSGVSYIFVKKISGRQFLIEFDDEEFRKSMEQEGWAWLKEWFVEIEPWSVFSYAKYKTTWLTIFGLPLHVWNHYTFHNIANIWEEVVTFDSKTFNFLDFSRGAMMIMTNQLKRIDEVIIINCGCEKYPVRVTKVGEDVISLFHCCQGYSNSNVMKLNEPVLRSSYSGLMDGLVGSKEDEQTSYYKENEFACNWKQHHDLDHEVSSKSKKDDSLLLVTSAGEVACSDEDEAACSIDLVPKIDVSNMEKLHSVNNSFEQPAVLHYGALVAVLEMSSPKAVMALPCAEKVTLPAGPVNISEGLALATPFSNALKFGVGNLDRNDDSALGFDKISVSESLGPNNRPEVDVDTKECKDSFFLGLSFSQMVKMDLEKISC